MKQMFMLNYINFIIVKSFIEIGVYTNEPWLMYMCKISFIYINLV